MVPVVIAIVTEGTTDGFTFILIGALEAFTGEAQGSLDTISQVTASRSARVVEVNVGFTSPPTGDPFMFH